MECAFAIKGLSFGARRSITLSLPTTALGLPDEPDCLELLGMMEVFGHSRAVITSDLIPGPWGSSEASESGALTGLSVEMSAVGQMAT